MDLMSGGLLFSEEMKNFSRQWLLPMFEFQWLLAIIILHIAALIGITIALLTKEWIVGISAFGGISLFFYCWLLLIYYAGTKYFAFSITFYRTYCISGDAYFFLSVSFRLQFLYRLNLMLTRKMKNIRIILQIIFCHPQGKNTGGSPNVVPIK